MKNVDQSRLVISVFAVSTRLHAHQVQQGLKKFPGILPGIFGMPDSREFMGIPGGLKEFPGIS